MFLFGARNHLAWSYVNDIVSKLQTNEPGNYTNVSRFVHSSVSKAVTEHGEICSGKRNRGQHSNKGKGGYVLLDDRGDNTGTGKGGRPNNDYRSGNWSYTASWQ